MDGQMYISWTYNSMIERKKENEKEKERENQVYKNLSLKLLKIQEHLKNMPWLNF